MTNKTRKSSRKRMEGRLKRYHKSPEGFYTEQKIESKSGKVVSEQVKPNRPMRRMWSAERAQRHGKAARELIRKGRTLMASKLRRTMSKLRKAQRAEVRRREKRGWV